LWQSDTTAEMCELSGVATVHQSGIATVTFPATLHQPEQNQQRLRLALRIWRCLPPQNIEKQ